MIPQATTDPADAELIDTGRGLLAAVRPLVGQLRFYAALEEVMQFVRQLNRYFNDQQPWALAKQPEDRARLQTVLYNVVEGLRIVSVLLEPAIPAKARQLRQSLGLGEYSFAQIETWGLVPAGDKIPDEAPILFPKIEIARDESEAKKKPKKKQKKESAPPQEKGEGGQITIDDFAKVELRVASVKAAEKVPKADKLLKLTLDVGGEERTVVSGIAQWYAPEDLPGKKVVVVVNLKPAKLRGIVSQGMILAAEDSEGNLALVGLDRDMESGSTVR